MIAGMEDAFVSDKKEVVIDYRGKQITFYAHEIGYMDSQNIAVQASNSGRNSLAMLVAQSVTDAEGNKFTYDEVIRLKKEYAEPLFAAVVAVHNYGDPEKKS